MSSPKLQPLVTALWLAFLLGCRSKPDSTETTATSATAKAAKTSSIAVPASPSATAQASASAPASIGAKAPAPEPASCDLPFPTVGQRWREQLTMNVEFSREPGPGNFRGQTRTENQRVLVEVRSVHAGTVTRAIRTAFVNGWHSEDIDDRTPDSQEQFWVGKGS